MKESNSFPVGYLARLNLCLHYDGISDGSEEKKFWTPCFGSERSPGSHVRIQMRRCPVLSHRVRRRSMERLATNSDASCLPIATSLESWIAKKIGNKQQASSAGLLKRVN